MMFTKMLAAVAFATGAAAQGDSAHQFSRLTISKPAALKEQFKQGINNMPAMFGLPFSHEGEIQGDLMAPSEKNNNGCSDFSNETKVAWSKMEKTGPVIALVYRGDCTFVTKVRHVQEMGAVAAVVIDNADESFIPYMADDGTGDKISIPSILIHKKDGDVLWKSVEAAANDTSAFAKNKVHAAITFNVPRPDNRVEWSIWASAGADQDKLLQFKKLWGPVGKALGASALLTPHYWFIDGASQGCYPKDPNLNCDNQCTNNGRYCSVDPDDDLAEGVSGADVVKENLRQLCLWKTLNSTTGGEYAIDGYWNYLTKFEDGTNGCVNKTKPEDKSTMDWENCSYELIKSTISDKVANDVKSCIENSGGYGDDLQTENSMIVKELELKKQLSLYVRPTVIVNEQRVIGSVACPEPYSPETCGVLGAICNGFANRSDIAACAVGTGCPIGQKKDACGACGGSVENTNDCKASAGAPGGAAEGGSVSVAAIIVIAVVFLIAVAGMVYWYMKRREDAMREDIDSLLKQYLPMQDGTTGA